MSARSARFLGARWGLKPPAQKAAAKKKLPQPKQASQPRQLGDRWGIRSGVSSDKEKDQSKAPAQVDDYPDQDDNKLLKLVGAASEAELNHLARHKGKQAKCPRCRWGFCQTTLFLLDQKYVCPCSFPGGQELVVALLPVGSFL